ncbi:MAG TPA: ABC transporter ATP-binding protein [Moheibacter sp.]|nr:ABC transporter ATP-binding protein [Moheibacter sp.]
MATINSIKDRLAASFTTLFYFYKYLRWKIFYLLFFNFIMVLLDSIGITMFVPLLQIADGNSHNLTGGNKKLFDIVEMIFGFLHLNVTVFNMLLLIVLVFVAKAIFVYFTLKYQVNALQSIAQSIRIKLSLGLKDLSFKEFVTADIGRIQNSLTGEAFTVALACNQYLDTIKNGMTVAIYLGFAFFLDWKFSILIITGGLMTNFVYRNFYNKTKALSREITSNNHSFSKIVIESINHFKYLKASGRNKEYTNRMIDQLNVLIENKIKVGTLSAKLQSLREPMMILIICGVIALQVTVFKTSLSSVLIILVLFYRAMGYIMNLQSSWNGYLGSIGSLENIQSFEKFLEDNKELKTGNKILQHIQTIELNNVGVSYGDFKVLQNINLKVQPNQSIAFVGESGAGKTTLVNVVCSLLDIDSGEFHVNGINFKEIKKSSYRSRIGYITQEPTIFNADIFDNVSFWEERTPENLAKFWKAIQMCSLENFIHSLPLKEKELLGNNGINVSGGQKQRISIARELYREVDLLIMDEATSALDSETEQEIKDSIESLQGKVTILSIAHRLSTIKNADTIYLMDKGQITAFGTFEALKIQSDHFRKLAELQGM